jgi:hypothetical protein
MYNSYTEPVRIHANSPRKYTQLTSLSEFILNLHTTDMYFFINNNENELSRIICEYQ